VGFLQVLEVFRFSLKATLENGFVCIILPDVFARCNINMVMFEAVPGQFAVLVPNGAAWSKQDEW